MPDDHPDKEIIVPWALNELTKFKDKMRFKKYLIIRFKKNVMTTDLPRRYITEKSIYLRTEL